MNNRYNHINLLHLGISRQWLCLIGLFFSSLTTVLHAEGTHDVAPGPDDLVMLLVGDHNYGNFATTDSPEGSRLYIQLNDASEVLYLGLSREFSESGNPASTGSYSFRIKSASNGQLVHGPFSMNSFVENISSWEEAGGPAILNDGVGYATDDDRFVFAPGEAGLYYIEFVSADYIGFWDFTVASNGTEIPGRVYSKNWALRTPTLNNSQPECVWDREFNGALYSYTTDGFVTRIDFADSGMQGLSFTMAFNTRGPGETGDIAFDRMSIDGQNITEDFAEHRVFLSEPDPILFPSGECGELNVAPYFICTGDGAYCLEVDVTRPGQVEVIIDVNQNNVYDEEIDRLLVHRFDEGAPLSTCLNWDGLLGNGSPAGPGVNVNLMVQYTQGVQHWTVFDGEFLKDGFCVEPVRPDCPSNASASILYWDDRNIIEAPGTGQPKDGRAGCSCEELGCRTWNNFDPQTDDCSQIDDNTTTGFGDKNSLNTWWFANTVTEVLAGIPLISVELLGVDEFCEGESTDLSFNFTSTSDITEITWTGPGGIIASGPDAPTVITVADTGLYTISVIDENGCSFSDTHELSSTNCPTDMELDITADQLSPLIGNTVLFTITVVNQGGYVAPEFTVATDWLAGLTEIQVLSPGGVLNGNSIIWENLSLGVGETLQLTFSGVVSPAFDYTISAEITYSIQDDPDSVPGNGVDTNGNDQCADDPGDEDDGDCVVLSPPACSINADISNVNCDPGGTLSDPADDTYSFTLLVTGSNGSGSWTTNLLGQTITGIYGQAQTFGPFDIAAGDISLEIEDDFFGDACSTTIIATAPASCSDQCLLFVESDAISCDDNGTSHDTSDDTFSFNFRVSGANTGGNWQASDGSSGLYDTWYTYSGYAVAEGNVSLVFNDVADGECSVDLDIEAPESCSPDCLLEADISAAICNNNGTPSDPTDDTFSFTVNVSGWNTSGTNWEANDPNNTSGTYGSVITMGPYAISGGDLNFNIIDPENPECSYVVAVAAPQTCSDECALSLEQGMIICDDNGTISDGADDTFTVEVFLNGANASASWTSSNGQSAPYGEWVTLGPFPVSGGDVTIDFSDDGVPDCGLSVEFEAPPACSTTCVISATASEAVCNDQGTPSDPTDDTYTFILTVSGANQSDTWTANDPLQSSGSYGVGQLMGPYLISEGHLDLIISDAADNLCSTDISVMPPVTCSDECAITVDVQAANILCDNNGTPSDGSDDLFSFDVLLTGFNVALTWTASNGQSGLYNELTNIGPFDIADGDVTIVFTDGDEVTCTNSITVAAPPSCSNVCAITEAIYDNVLCDDNGTPADPSDDTFTFVALLDGVNLGGNWTASDGSSGLYAVPVLFGPFAIGDGEVSLTFTDSADESCMAALTVPAPVTCSDLCAATATAFNYQCFDNDTPTDFSDDVFTFDLLVESVNNTGPGWIQPSGNSGAYGQIYTQGPFLIADGEFTWTVRDVETENCTASVLISPPASCSEDCILMLDVSTVICDDGGTEEDSSDDVFIYTITVDGVNVSGSWTASDGTTGNYGEEVNSVPHYYSEGPLTITISDSNGFCPQEIVINPPAPALLCPEDVYQRSYMAGVQVIQGQLDEDDLLIEEPPCFLALNSTPILLGDRFMEPVDILTPDTSESIYTFFFFSDMELALELEGYGEADGTSSLFRGDYMGYTDPCCFNMNYPSGLGDDSDMMEVDPLIDTTGMFDQDMHLVQHFSQTLKGLQEYSLVATTYGSNVTGNYAWVIVSNVNMPMTLYSEEVISDTFSVRPVLADLTYNDILWAQDAVPSLDNLGHPMVEPLCGLDTLFFTDSLEWDNSCEEAYIHRTFTIEYAGQADSCDQLLTFRRPRLEDIILPPATVTFQCGDDYAVNDEGYPHPYNTGYPLLSSGTDYDTLFEQTPYFNLGISYKDIPNPDTTHFQLDLTREWNIVDACNGDTLYVIPQRIKIGQFGLPRLVCPTSSGPCSCPDDNVLIFGLDQGECTATVDIPLADLVGFCDESRIADWSITTELFRSSDNELLETILFDGARDVSNLERGDYTLRYIAEDLDGNIVERSCAMRVVDFEAPTAICRGPLTVAIGEEDVQLILQPDQIDLNSSDNCGPAALSIRRYYNEGTENCSGELAGEFGEWTDQIALSCCDAGETFLVELQTMDLDSNINSCNLMLSVVDDIVPQLSGLEEQQLSCNMIPLGFEPTDSLQLTELFGMPQVADNCTALVTELEPELSWDNCNLGTITRKFTAVDEAGNTTPEVYEQLISIERNNSYSIRFPKDVSTNCLETLGTLDFIGGGCGDFDISYEDVDLAPLNGECLRIQRTYTIINNCEYDGSSTATALSRNENCEVEPGTEDVWLVVNNGTAFADADNEAFNQFPPAGEQCGDNPVGYWRDLLNVGAWEYTQLIIVTDETAPVVAFATPEAFCTTDDRCEGFVSLTVEVLESCLPERTEVQLFLDQNNDGTNDVELTETSVLSRENNSYLIAGDFPVGDHAFVFEAVDGCNNQSSERIAFSVVDCYIAQPACVADVQVQLSPVVPAVDLDGDGIPDEAAVLMSAELLIDMAGLDDCSGAYSYSVNRPGEVINFANDNIILTCEDRYQAERELVVRDNAYNPYAVQPDGSIGGPNYQTCIVTISVQDSLEACSTCAESELEIEGVIRTRTNLPMNGVEVHLYIDDIFDENTFTVDDGKFEFPALAFSTNYEVRPYKNDDTGNGVTTLDMIAILRHLNGQVLITDPYTLLAADVNADGQVTLNDFNLMEQLLLGNISTWPANTSWRFIPADFPLTDIATEIPDSYSYYNLLVCQFAQDFIAVKIGDLNGSASEGGMLAQTAGRANESWLLSAPDYELRKGDIYRIPIRANDLKKLSGLDLELVLNTDFLKVLEVEEGKMKAQQMNTKLLERGLLRGVWVANSSDASAGEPLFTLVVEAQAATSLATVLSMSGRTPSLAYDHALEEYQLQLQFTDNGQEAVLLKNQPDPFRETTQISFYLPEAGSYLLEVTDATGKVLRSYQERAAAGKQQLTISGEGLPPGVLFYTLTFDDRQISRRMVKL